MPDLVRALCWNYGAWIVGSRAANFHSSSDWDLIVHPESWMKAAILLRTQGHIEANSFGGWKVNHYIDVWPSLYIQPTQNGQCLFVESETQHNTKST